MAQLSSPHGRVWQVTEPTTDAAKRLKALETKPPKAILDLAKVFRFTVTAEGVEDEEQLAILKTLGCQHYQGFLTSRPLTVKALESLLGAALSG